MSECAARQSQISQDSYHDKHRDHPEDGKHPDMYSKGHPYPSYPSYIMMSNMNSDSYMNNGSMSPPMPRTVSTSSSTLLMPTRGGACSTYLPSNCINFRPAAGLSSCWLLVSVPFANFASKRQTRDAEITSSCAVHPNPGWSLSLCLM
uniref:CTNNB1 binding N-teminal domain-containing protein n=1 Tax=Nothobranchius furzeri TaxID=105023 RepID=A0A8C6LB36_NOTFU